MPESQPEITNSTPVEFKVFTPTALKAWEDQDSGDMFLSGVASSTVEDLHGSTMEPTALDDMVRAANANLTIFLNHSYKVPEDVAGSVETASMRSEGMDEATGKPVYDLRFDKVRVNRQNGRAVEAFKAIKGGTKLGFSIGANIPEGGAVKDKKTGRWSIRHVTLLETSIVSIPANPRSWVDYAVKSLRSAEKDDDAEVTVKLDTETVKDAVESAVADAIVHYDDLPTNGTISITSTSPTIVEEVETVETIEVEDGSTPDGNPSQEAPPSDPGTDGAAASASIDASDLSSVQAIFDLLNETAAQLVEAKKAQIAAEQRALDAERERDTVTRQAADVIRDTSQLIERLGALPLGQKASFKAIKSDFDSLEEVLGPEVVAMLRSKSQ